MRKGKREKGKGRGVGRRAVPELPSSEGLGWAGWLAGWLDQPQGVALPGFWDRGALQSGKSSITKPDGVVESIGWWLATSPSLVSPANPTRSNPIQSSPVQSSSAQPSRAQPKPDGRPVDATSSGCHGD